MFSFIKQQKEKIIQLWFSRRVPRTHQSWLITNRRIFILPTSYGYVFSFLLLIMLLCAINYINSMAFSFTFLLTGLGFVNLYKTHANLLNLKIEGKDIEPVFCGEKAKFILNINNISTDNKYSLQAIWHRKEMLNNTQIVNVVSTKKERVYLPIEAHKRGWLLAPRFLISSFFPFGFARAWSWVELDMKCLVYPKPAVDDILLISEENNQEGQSIEKIGQEEFTHLRNYIKGDSLKSIDWKNFAKRQQNGNPMVKQFIEVVGNEVWIDYNKLPKEMGKEERLSQLCRWIVDLDKSGISYGLRLPGQMVEPNIGHNHYHHCLTQLALYD